MEYDDRWHLQRQSATSTTIGLPAQREILHGSDPRLRMLLAANPAAHPAIQRELAGSRWCWAPLGGNPGLAVDVQRHLASSTWADMQSALLRHPALDPGVQGLLAQSGHRDVRLSLAGYRALAPAVAHGLADDPGLLVRLAANPALPEVLLARFLDSGAAPVRAGAAGNPLVQRQHLLRLARDGAARVRRAVASSAVLPPELVDGLCADRERPVRRALVGNPAIGRAAAQRIAGRRPARGGLAAALAGNPVLPADVQQRYAAAGDSAVAARLAGNTAVGESAAAVLAGHAEPQVRAALAANPALPRSLMPLLAADPEPRVRAGLAGNPALTRDCRQRLAGDDAPAVLAAVVHRHDFDRPELRALLMGLIGDADPNSPRRAVLRAVPLWDGPTAADAAVLDLPITGPAAVAAGAGDRLVDAACVHADPLVRLALLCRAEIDPGFAAEAFADPDPVVAGAARLAVLRRM